jgi:outer membrane protein OmpA-like peptidoglycan-associated protein
MRNSLLLVFLIAFLPMWGKTDAVLADRIDSLSVQVTRILPTDIPTGSNAALLHSELRERVAMLQSRKIKGKKVDPLEVASAEYLLEATLIEIENAQLAAMLTDMRGLSAQLNRQIDSVTVALNERQNDRIVRLTSQLDEERNGARIAREEAEQTKEMLALQQEEAERVRQQLKKQREEADKQLDELESNLISVRRDARGTIVSMSDMLFDFGKSGLKSELKTSLAKIAGILSVYRQPSVTIEGHTDNVGSVKGNQRLSVERAENVRKYLVEQGVDSWRLHAVGYGFRKPVASNATDKGRAKNRRVELIIEDPETSGE